MAQDVCTYCDAPATTRDHVPAKAIFARPRPSTLLTVPSCATCNHSAHLDDDYFRDMILWYHRVAGLPEAADQVSAMVRRVTKPSARGYWNLLYGQMRTVALRTKAGLFLGNMPAFVVNAARVNKVVERYVRALFRHTFGRRLPLNSTVVVMADPDSVRAKKGEVETLLHGPNVVTVQEKVFWYTRNVAKDNGLVSVWLLVFFDEYAVLAFVREA